VSLFRLLPITPNKQFYPNPVIGTRSPPPPRTPPPMQPLSVRYPRTQRAHPTTQTGKHPFPSTRMWPLWVPLRYLDSSPSPPLYNSFQDRLTTGACLAIDSTTLLPPLLPPPVSISIGFEPNYAHFLSENCLLFS